MKIEDEIIKFIIEEFTFESGVRKLKEIFFDIVGGINLDILNCDSNVETPYIITKDIVFKYMNKRHEVVHRKVCEESLIGSINGMYATALGTGGILPITCRYYPCDKFLSLKLTGLQQEVMKESMHLSMTVAWDKTEPKVQAEIRKKYDTPNCNGINVHAGDLDIQKEGPSAGAAICCSIYSLFNGLKIKQNIGITGELSMRGEVMAIGGLSDKIVGSLKANVNKFIYPKENMRQFEDFMEKYKDNPQLDGVTFHSCGTIDEVFELIFDK
jgi:ATP-dependent Lon protease